MVQNVHPRKNWSSYTNKQETIVKIRGTSGFYGILASNRTITPHAPWMVIVWRTVWFIRQKFALMTHLRRTLVVRNPSSSLDGGTTIHHLRRERRCTTNTPKLYNSTTQPALLGMFGVSKMPERIQPSLGLGWNALLVTPAVVFDATCALKRNYQYFKQLLIH